MSREVNRKSQKLFPFVKIIENHGGVLIHLNMYGYSLIIFCCHLGKGDNFIRILFAENRDIREATLLFPIFASHLIRDQLFKKRICSLRSKFFPLRVDPILKGCIVQGSK